MYSCSVKVAGALMTFIGYETSWVRAGTTFAVAVLDRDFSKKDIEIAGESVLTRPSKRMRIAEPEDFNDLQE